MNQHANNDFNLINAWLLEAESNESTCIYLIPIVQQKVEIAAVLFALHYPFQQFVITDPNLSAPQLFFWIIQPKNVAIAKFKYHLSKICRFAHIDTFCCLYFVNTRVNILILKSFASIEKILHKNEVATWLIAHFWTDFIVDPTQTKIQQTDQQFVINEPKTNFARLARQLKGKAVLEALNLS